MASNWMGQQSEAVCRNCGSRHFSNSRQNRICGGMVKTADYLASAAGIREKAAEAREEGIAAWNAAQSATGPRQARRLAQAEAAFALAYELEN